MTRPWLTIRMTKIVLVTFRVPADLLLPYVPRGSGLDTSDDDPQLHLVSLVALHMSGLRLYRLGLPVPMAQRFPQVNLRFYVRRGPLRAVVFLRQLVTAPLVMLGARFLYAQPCHLAALSHETQTSHTIITAQTRIGNGAQPGAIRVRAHAEPVIPDVGSQERFLTARPWSFYRTRSGRSFRYQLSHPVWRIYPIEKVDVTVDPGAILGPEWQVIDWQDHLHSVIFAEGSAATMSLPEPLEAPLDIEPTDQQLRELVHEEGKDL